MKETKKEELINFLYGEHFLSEKIDRKIEIATQPLIDKINKLQKHVSELEFELYPCPEGHSKCPDSGTCIKPGETCPDLKTHWYV